MIKVLSFISLSVLLIGCTYSDSNTDVLPQVIITSFPMEIGTQWNYEHSGIEFKYNDTTNLSVRRFHRDFTIEVEKDTSLEKNLIVKKIVFGVGLEDSTVRYFNEEQAGIYEYIYFPFSSEKTKSPWLKVLWVKLPLEAHTSWEIENQTYTDAFGFSEKSVLNTDFFLIEEGEEQTLEVFTSNLDNKNEYFLPLRKKVSEWISRNGVVKMLIHEKKVIELDDNGEKTGAFYDKDELYLLKNYSSSSSTK